MEQSNASTSITDAPLPSLCSSHETDDDPSNATSAVNTPASSVPARISFIDMPDIILESIFLRVPFYDYPQIRTTCRALNALLFESLFIREVVVKRGEIIIPVKFRWESRVARYRSTRTGRISWRLGSNLGSCYYRCYNIREIALPEADNEAETPTPIPCHRGLFCPWIECGRWHRWLDGGLVRTLLRNMAPEFENDGPLQRPTAQSLCSVCSHARPASCCSCMASLLYIKNPITGVYKRLPFIDGTWTSKLKCIASYGTDQFRVLVVMPSDTHEGIDQREQQISFVKTMIYDSAIDSWRDLTNCSHYHLKNIKVVDSHGVYCNGTMYWLLEAAASLIVFRVENQRWEILKVRNPPPGFPLGLVANTEHVLMAEAQCQRRVLVIWKLNMGNSLSQSHNEKGEWLEISRSSEEIFQEFQATEMVIHSARSPRGDDIVCFENLLERKAVTYNVTSGSWGRSNLIHCF